MCGFLAFRGNVSLYRDQLISAHKSMSYRGLDRDDCQNIEEGLTYFFAHNTLPIVSVDPIEYHQPKKNPRPYVFAGEIFDYPSDRYQNDTEFMANEIVSAENLVYLHSYDGFWSGATITDEGNFLAFTDYLAQKPVYYRTDICAVASEPYALSLIGTPPVKDQLFFANICKWGYDPTGRTPWETIRQIPPGHYLLNRTLHPYWDWSKIEVNSDLETLLEISLQNRLTGKQDISVLLSGGLDSTIVHYLASKNNRSATSLHVENNESEYVRSVTSDYKTITIQDDCDREHAIRACQSPIDLGSLVPQYALARALKKEGFHVVMTGDGADELFGGYRRIEQYDSQASDVFMELPYYHNSRLDRIMMNQTIELRTPFLAPKVIKYALELPFAERKNKKILKDIFRGKIPDVIIDRPKKPLKTAAVERDLLENTRTNIEIFNNVYF